MTPVETLKPGDVLLYPATSLFGKLIALKTWHSLSHVEVCVRHSTEETLSAASRDGKGVAIYPARLKDVRHVLRPTVPFDLRAAMQWFDQHAHGQPYGWLDLLAFIGVTKDMPGMVCSSFATSFLRAGGVPMFNNEPPNKVAPFQFLTSELLREVSTSPTAAQLARV